MTSNSTPNPNEEFRVAYRLAAERYVLELQKIAIKLYYPGDNPIKVPTIDDLFPFLK